MLSKLGDNVEKGRVPFIGRLRHRNHGESRVWGWVIDRALAPPGGLASSPPAACCVVLALPALNMHTINPGVAGLPHDLPIMQTYERIQAAFPGGPLPARSSSVQAEDVTTPAVQKGIEELNGRRHGPDERHRQPGQARRDRLASRCPGNGTDDASDAALGDAARPRRSRRRSAASPAPRPT